MQSTSVATWTLLQAVKHALRVPSLADAWPCLQIRLLREILEWGQGIRRGGESLAGDSPNPLTVRQIVQGALKHDSEGSDIIVAVFPEGTLERLPTGTTVAKVIREKARPRADTPGCLF